MSKLCKCGEIVQSRCSKCYPLRTNHTRTTKERGYDSAWQKVRDAKLCQDPLCERCKSLEKMKAADQVHHIEKIINAPQLRLVLSNLMSVCSDCHYIVEQMSISDVRRIVERARGETCKA